MPPRAAAALAALVLASVFCARPARRTTAEADDPERLPGSAARGGGCAALASLLRGRPGGFGVSSWRRRAGSGGLDPDAPERRRRLSARVLHGAVADAERALRRALRAAGRSRASSLLAVGRAGGGPRVNGSGVAEEDDCAICFHAMEALAVGARTAGGAPVGEPAGGPRVNGSGAAEADDDVHRADGAPVGGPRVKGSGAADDDDDDLHRADGVPVGGRRVSGSGVTEAEEEEEEEEEEEDDCAICFHAIEEPKVLLCNHSFCSGCIDLWLQQSEECPKCRAVVRTRPRFRLEAALESIGAILLPASQVVLAATEAYVARCVWRFLRLAYHFWSMYHPGEARDNLVLQYLVDAVVFLAQGLVVYIVWRNVHLLLD